METLWILVVAVGPLVLGGMIAYALLTRRRLRGAERNAQRAATERLYRDSR